MLPRLNIPGKREEGFKRDNRVYEVQLERGVYVFRDAVDDLRGIVGRSWCRPRGELPTVAAVVCYFSDSVAERPLTLDDLLRHDCGAGCAGVCLM